MGNITTMTVFVWTVNVLIFLAQFSMLAMNPNLAGDGNVFYNVNGTVLEDYSTDTNTLMPNSEAVQSELDVAGSSGVSEGTTGIFFIDVLASIKTWIQGTMERFVAIVLGPYNIINSIPGLPKEFVGAVSLIWYAASVLLLVLTIFGRNT